MLTFRFTGADGCMLENETLTSGMIGKKVKLEFSSEWSNLKKTAVFMAGSVTRDVVGVNDEVEIPAEVLAVPLKQLYVGVYGVSTDGRVTPTIQAMGPIIEPGTDPSGDEGTNPELAVWAQLLCMIGDLGDLTTEARDSLVNAINEAVKAGNGGNVDLSGYVKSVNGNGPDAAGNVEITIPDSSQNVDLTGYATEEYVQEYAQPKGDYLTEHQSLDGYAKTEDIPTKPEDIGAQPAGDYLTEVPSGYATETFVTAKIAEAELAGSDVDLSGFATKDDIPTKVSQLTNDSGYLTGFTETDPTVPAWAKNATKPTYTAYEVGALPDTTVIPTVPTKVSAFTNDAGYLTEHQDISGKADKSGLTLGIHTDGLVYLFVDGEPVGAGIELTTAEVYGYVDENNNIIVSGNLADGTYSVKYEMEDASTVDIGNLVLDTNVYYSVTNTLTNCVSSNSATQAVEGGSYSATISAKSGYELSSVKVTMGGTDISSTAVSGGTISIANVTGNIVITAVAEEAAVTPSYTNVLPLSVDANGNDFVGNHENGGDGYEYGYRISGSSGSQSAQDGVYCSGFIPVSGINDVVRIANITLYDDSNRNNVVFYDANKSYVIGKGGGAGSFDSFVKVENGIYRFSASSVTASDVSFFRFSCGGITDETVVTINEEITD